MKASGPLCIFFFFPALTGDILFISLSLSLSFLSLFLSPSLSQNMAGTDGYGYELEPKWVEGPYEMQDAAMGSAFQVRRRLTLSMKLSEI